MDEITFSLVAYEVVNFGLVCLMGALLGSIAADVTHWWQKRREAKRRDAAKNDKRGGK